MADLKTNYLGKEIDNPIIIASSGLTESPEKIKELEDNGAAAVVLKSIFEEEILLAYNADLDHAIAEGSYNPDRFDHYDLHIKQENIKNYFKLIEDSKKTVNIPIVASINCVSAYEWPAFAKHFEEAGADGLELNIFIMPSDLKHDSATNEKKYFEIIRKVQENISIPISVKISYYFSSLAKTIHQLSDTGISSLVLFNRFHSPDINIENQEVVMTNILSSPADLRLSLRWIGMMADRAKCDLIASTGIHSSEAVIKQLLAGAKAIQMASAIYKYGAPFIGKMLGEIEAWMNQKGYKSINNFNGKLSQTGIEEPDLYERAQFMKYFSHHSH